MDYNELAKKDMVQKTITALNGQGYEAMLVGNGKEALEMIKSMIPEGASVMNGSSVTLDRIGYLEYLAAAEHKWVDLHAKVNAENDKEKRAKLRRESVLSDYYLGSVHALVENGEFVIASNTGSQLPHVVYTSPNLILVVSTKKIVPSLEEGMKRLEDFVFPLEDKQSREKYGSGTRLNKIVIFKGESEYSSRKIMFILVDEDLGF